MKSKPYEDYLLEDFVWDESFRKWAKNLDNGKSNFWGQWIAQHPEKGLLVIQARQIVLQLSKDGDDPFDEELVGLWQRISQSAAEPDQLMVAPPQRLLVQWKKARWAAALAGLLVIISAIGWLSLPRERQVRYATAYGETRTVALPDQSTVTLNANSAIHYEANWRHQFPREIWLEGQAYFSVAHAPGKQKFIVHTRDLAVEVLGTQFDVNTRRGKTRVVLNTGNVKLRIPKHEADSVLMRPGELAEVQTQYNGITKRMVNTQKYISWRESQLVFDETPLREIAQLLEDSYGWKVYFGNPELSDETFTGTIERNNIEMLLTILEKTFGLTITRNQNTITLTYLTL